MNQQTQNERKLQITIYLLNRQRNETVDEKDIFLNHNNICLVYSIIITTKSIYFFEKQHEQNSRRHFKLQTNLTKENMKYLRNYLRYIFSSISYSRNQEF